MQQSRAVLSRAVKLKCTRSFSLSCALHGRAIPEAEYAAMAEFTEQLVDTAGMNPPLRGWKHTEHPRGTERRLGNLISTVDSTVRAPSVDKTAFDAGGEMGHAADSEDSSRDAYTPGTFVELRRNEISTHGVVLGERFENSRWHVMVLISTGEVWDPLRDDVMFSVPSLTTPDLAKRCSMLDIAVEPVQLNARIRVLQSIRQIERAVEDALSKVLRQGINVYSIVKSRDPNAWASTTVTEVARLFSPKPTLVTIFAAHKYLMARPECFVASHAYRISQSFDVRPESHIKTIKMVEEWCRQQDGPLADFARRAMPAMEANRKLHSASRNDLPSQRPAKHEWTPEDVSILSFLHQALRPTRSIQTDPYSIGQSAIMRKLHPAEAVTDHQVHMALVDLGVYAPWQDLFSLRRELDLDQEDPVTSPKVQSTNALVQRSLSTPARSGPLGPEDFYATDPLDHLRHDFGDMPVYVVDDVHAEELDDGVSVEAIPGEPDNYWVHVHVADPASTIPPTHILAQRALHQSQSVYFIHRSWPLFPKSLMFSGRPGFSLATQTPQTENRVLTFSSKVNLAGEMIDFTMRAGIARNFVKMSYDEVDLVLTGSVVPRSYPFSLPPPTPTPAHLPDGQLKDLRTLHMLRNALVKYRLDRGVIDSDNEVPIIKGFKTPQNVESPTMRASHFHGFPDFTYCVSRMADEASGARSIVAEAMKLACRCASRWCAERGVDVPRRTAGPFEATPGAFEKLRSMRDENGYVDIAKLAALTTAMPSAEYSLYPGSHWSLAIPEGEGYTRATSPLRRFSDMLVHYQIHSSLLGRKPDFSTSYLEDYLQRLQADERLKKRTEKLHLRFWVLTALKRWMEAPRNDIPDPLVRLQAVLMNPPKYNTVIQDLQSEVRIPALGITASLTGFSQQMAASWEIGKTVPVKVKDVQLGVKPTLTVAMRSK
ncbi:hypothetical protein B0H10DRAFT_2008372 [Mycena sp. CBHHK59/15]|nr:hypothetical protein B0H10DRAFT_2008372 [Mycena sp. CBHHK59/15]